MTTWSNWLNIVGLVIDLIGALMLFLTRFKPMAKMKFVERPITPDPGILNRLSSGRDLEQVIDSLMDNINFAIDDLNNRLTEMNDHNDEAYEKSCKWFIVIVIGFLLQLTASILQLEFLQNS